MAAVKMDNEELLGVLVNKYKAQLIKWFPQYGLGKAAKKTAKANHRHWISRFLIARKYNREETEKILDDMWAWRDEWLPVEEKDVMEELAKGKWYQLAGRTDKEGHPIFLIHGRLWDPQKRDLATAMKAIVWLAERATQEFYAARFTEKGPPCDDGRVFVLYDRAGFSLKNFDKEMLKQVGKLQANYPESLEKVLVVPTGVLFRMLWKAAQYFFDPVTRGKFHPLAGYQEVYGWIEERADLPPPWTFQCPFASQELLAQQTGRALPVAEAVEDGDEKEAANMAAEIENDG